MERETENRLSILVCNDDGIDAEGITCLVQTLSRVADVYVSAPHAQRSASGHAITLGRSFDLKVVDDVEGAVSAIEMTGTPADCVKMGLRYFEDQGVKMDLVFAGINHGSNLGTDTLYSGTVSAALEGSLCDKPSIAVSVGSHVPKHGFDYAAELALHVLEHSYPHMKHSDHNKENAMTLNVNVPDIPPEDIKGVVVTKLGRRQYYGYFKPDQIQEGHLSVKYGGVPVVYESTNLGIDVLADQQGYATITPLRYALTWKGKLEDVKTWGLEFEK